MVLLCRNNLDRAILARFGPNGFSKLVFELWAKYGKVEQKVPTYFGQTRNEMGGWSATEVRCGAVPFGPNEMRNLGYCPGPKREGSVTELDSGPSLRQEGCRIRGSTTCMRPNAPSDFFLSSFFSFLPQLRILV